MPYFNNDGFVSDKETASLPANLTTSRPASRKNVWKPKFAFCCNFISAYTKLINALNIDFIILFALYYLVPKVPAFKPGGFGPFLLLKVLRRMCLYNLVVVSNSLSRLRKWKLLSKFQKIPLSFDHIFSLIFINFIFAFFFKNINWTNHGMSFEIRHRHFRYCPDISCT